jgi:hypothetical protein
MNFVFYHSGYNKNLPNLLVQSILKTNPGSDITQVSDRNTKPIAGVTQFVQFDSDKITFNDLCKKRCEFYSQLETQGPAAYIDTDMLVIKKLNPEDIFRNSDVVLCKRFWDGTIYSTDTNDNLYTFRNKSLSEIWPYLGCFVACRDNSFWNSLYKIIQTLPKEKNDWFADQHALKIFADLNNFSYVSEQQYGCLPDQVDNNIEQASILHFKGSRKKIMEQCYHNILC